MSIDDHEVFRSGLIQLINQSDWGTVVAEADTPTLALERIKSASPDILLLDLYLGNHTKSYDFISELKHLSPKTKIILLTVSEDEKDIYEASQYDVDGYLLKSTPFSQLESAILNIWNGEVIISERLGSTLFKELQNKKQLQGLSKRERNVFRLIQKNMTNKEIAAELNISENTVKIHVGNVLYKMGVNKRSELSNL